MAENNPKNTNNHFAIQKNIPKIKPFWLLHQSI